MGHKFLQTAYPPEAGEWRLKCFRGCMMVAMPFENIWWQQCSSKMVDGRNAHEKLKTNLGNFWMMMTSTFPSQIQWDDVSDDDWWTEEKRRCLSFFTAYLASRGIIIRRDTQMKKYFTEKKKSLKGCTKKTWDVCTAIPIKCHAMGERRNIKVS